MTPIAATNKNAPSLVLFASLRTMIKDSVAVHSSTLAAAISLRQPPSEAVKAEHRRKLAKTDAERSRTQSVIPSAKADDSHRSIVMRASYGFLALAAIKAYNRQPKVRPKKGATKDSPVKKEKEATSV